MAKIPFNIKFKPQIESGEYKVETRDGKSTRIICWDRKYGYPICGLVYEKSLGCENYVNAYENGRTSINGIQEMNNDLFLITPEPELSEFEQEYLRLYKEGYADGKAGSKPISDDALKEYAAELLELARKEIMDGWSKGLRDTQDISGKSYNDWYQLGLENGKAEALKDLPRWRTWGNGACGNGRGTPIAIVKRWINDYQLVDALGIQGEQYIMLSDLEKLPKED